MAVTVDASEVVDQVLVEADRLRTAAIDLVLESCRADCPVSTPSPTNETSGTLRDSLEVVDRTDEQPVFGASIVSPLEYAQFTDDVDTGPHEIRASRALVLRFWWEEGPAGPDIYHFKKVNHPGTRGQHWFAEKNPQRWNDALDEVAT